MTAGFSNGRSADQRRDIALRLRRIEIIEGLLEFDLVSLQLYADSVADERQFLSRLLSGMASKN